MQNEETYYNINRNFSLNGSADFHPSKKWHLNYSTIYDFDKNKLVEQKIHIRRDLHRWEMVFHWIPNGYRSGYYFRINLEK